MMFRKWLGTTPGRYLQCQRLNSERREHFAKIGIEGGKAFDPARLSPELKAAIEQGRGDAMEAFAGTVKEMKEGKITSGECFGTREFMKNNYLNRWLATIGIWVNSELEAMHPVYQVDSSGQELSGSNRYSLTRPGDPARSNSRRN